MESQLKEKTAHLFTIFMLFILAVLLFILFMIVVIVTANKPISEDYKVEIIKVKKDIAELSITLPHAFQEFISALLIQSAIICVFFASKLLEFYHFLIRKSLDFYDSLFFSQKDYEAAKTYQVKLKLETFDNLRLSDSETEDRLYTLRPQMEKYLTYLAPAEALPLLISSRLTKASRRLYWLGVFIAPSFILNIHFYIVDAVKILTCNIISLIIFSILIIFVYFNNG